MKSFRMLLMATVAVLCSCSEGSELDYDRLNRQAAQEYLTPIRSGYVIDD